MNKHLALFSLSILAACGGSGGDEPVPVSVLADFSANSTNVAPGANVSFTDASTGSPTTWAWEFEGGEPATSSGQNPNVTYKRPGTYTVKLTVSNGKSNHTASKSAYITVAWSGLVGQYSFSGNANDKSGNSLNGIVSGAVLTSDRNGLANAAYQFDGVNDFINLSDNAKFKFTNEFSFAAWSKPTGPGSANSGVYVCKEGEYEIARFSDGTVQWAIANTNPGWVWKTGATAGSSPLNTWIHIVYTYKSGKAKTYINGVLKSSIDATGAIVDVHTNGNKVYLGGRELHGQFYAGALDEVHIFNREISAEEAKIVYEQ